MIYLDDSMTELAVSVLKALNQLGLHPSRIGKTVDGSSLFQFTEEGRKRIVDVYPTGEIVVIVREGEVDNVFELDGDELPLILELVQNGMADLPPAAKVDPERHPLSESPTGFPQVTTTTVFEADGTQSSQHSVTYGVPPPEQP